MAIMAPLQVPIFKFEEGAVFLFTKPSHSQSIIIIPRISQDHLE